VEPCWGLVARERPISNKPSMVSPTALLPQRCPRRGWQGWALSQLHGAPRQCLLPPPSPLCRPCRDAGREPSGAWPATHAEVKASSQPLLEPGLCGHGAAPVLVTSELLRPLVTCCLVAGTPLLPAWGFAAWSCPCSAAGTSSQRPAGAGTSAHPASPRRRRAVRVLGLSGQPGTQATCDYFRGQILPWGHRVWLRDRASDALCCWGWTRDTILMGADHTNRATTALQAQDTSLYHQEMPTARRAPEGAGESGGLARGRLHTMLPSWRSCPSTEMGMVHHMKSCSPGICQRL